MSKETSTSSSNDQMLKAMQQQFERMFRMMEGVNEKLERHDGIDVNPSPSSWPNNFQVSNDAFKVQEGPMTRSKSKKL